MLELFAFNLKVGDPVVTRPTCESIYISRRTYVQRFVVGNCAQLEYYLRPFTSMQIVVH